MSKVEQGQSFINKVLEQTGSVEGLLATALLNGISITDDLEIGFELKTDIVYNTSVIEILKERKPANAQIFTTDIPTYMGIGFMEIGNNFIVG